MHNILCSSDSVPLLVFLYALMVGHKKVWDTKWYTKRVHGWYTKYTSQYLLFTCIVHLQQCTHAHNIFVVLMHIYLRII